MNNEQDSTQSMDDVPAVDNGQSEQDLLDAVMRNSHLSWMRLQACRYPMRKRRMMTRTIQLKKTQYETDEAVSEEEEESDGTEEETEGEDAPEGATQDPDVFTADDLDLDAQSLCQS